MHVANLFAGGDDAAMGHFTNCAFKLNRSMKNMETFAQPVVYLAQNAFAGGGRYVSDTDVAGQSVGIRSDAPDVQVMNVVDAVDSSDGG